jgi:cell wall-associated NlpC family hydrolase
MARHHAPCNDRAKGLHPAVFLLDFASMTCNKSITFLLSVAAIVFSGIVTAQTNEQQQRLSDEPSLFERYTNSAQDLILKGLELVGINYRRGGTDPDNGLDCSGFVQIVFKDAVGMLLPRTAREQSEMGNIVDRNELKAGDLVFFNTMRRTFSHVGIYLGDNRFLHAPRAGAEIRVEDMSQGYWVKRYNGARRVVER